jgi:DNA-directed RNA polymerase specialized sigma subunit
MSRPIYRRGETYAVTVRELLGSAANPQRDGELDRYQIALVRAVRERLTNREIQCMSAYYIYRQNIATTARRLGVHPSTVSRNIHRGEVKLDKLIRLAKEISPVHFSFTA